MEPDEVITPFIVSHGPGSPNSKDKRKSYQAAAIATAQGGVKSPRLHGSPTQPRGRNNQGTRTRAGNEERGEEGLTGQGQSAPGSPSGLGGVRGRDRIGAWGRGSESITKVRRYIITQRTFNTRITLLSLFTVFDKPSPKNPTVKVSESSRTLASAIAAGYTDMGDNVSLDGLSATTQITGGPPLNNASHNQATPFILTRPDHFPEAQM